MLLANGAEVGARTNWGLTPLHWAAHEGRRDVAELLITRGAQVNATAYNGETPLHVAAEQGHKDVAELLIARGAQVNATAVSGGGTPLHIAAQKGLKSIVELLLANGAEVGARDDMFETPLKYAVEDGHGDVAELLRQHGGRLRTAAREIKLSVRDKKVYAGDIPFILSSRDATGEVAGGLSGAFTGSISADLNDLILHFSEVPWDLTLGVQVEGANQLDGAVALRRNLCQSAFIDPQGLVFPGEAIEVDQTGPSITVKFSSPGGIGHLAVQVKTKSGRVLKTHMEEGGPLTIEDVPREMLYLTITSSASDGRWASVLFPAFRSASGGVVVYTMNDVWVRRAKQ